MKGKKSERKYESCHGNDPLKILYRKPTLHRYGSIVSLTAGLIGSVPDASGPGTKAG